MCSSRTQASQFASNSSASSLQASSNGHDEGSQPQAQKPASMLTTTQMVVHSKITCKKPCLKAHLCTCKAFVMSDGNSGVASAVTAATRVPAKSNNFASAARADCIDTGCTFPVLPALASPDRCCCVCTMDVSCCRNSMLACCPLLPCTKACEVAGCYGTASKLKLHEQQKEQPPQLLAGVLPTLTAPGSA